MTWSELCDELTALLIVARIENATAEARWIVERVGGAQRGEPRGSRDDSVFRNEEATATATARARDMAVRRGSGEPLQYVLGEWTFRDFEVYLDSRVLIPRPETEMTAEVAIGEAGALGIRVGRGNRLSGIAPPPAGQSGEAGTVQTGPGQDDAVQREGAEARPTQEAAHGDEVQTGGGDGGGAQVADLGTGSGVLALTLAREFADVTVWASDISADALAVARANLAGAGTVSQSVRLVEGDWFGALPSELRGRLSLIVSNPPYVGDDEDLPPVVIEHEPTSALFSGPTGLEDLESILRAAPEWLTRPGTLVLEHAPHQAADLLALARALDYPDVEVRDDLAGRPRVLVARVFPSS